MIADAGGGFQQKKGRPSRILGVGLDAGRAIGERLFL
jgi:hypothetical protein